jgi:enoyl-CoA hydratase/carnithine racemase
MTDEILHRVEQGVAVTTLNRPAARNALTFAMYERIQALAGEIDADPAVRAWIIEGGPDAFAAGTDIAQFTGFRTAEDAHAYEARIDAVLVAVERCGKPTLAAIAGACTGGGFALAAVCDLRLAAANARLGMPIARTLGNTLSMANHARLAALLGPARTLDLVLTARLMEAAEAQAIGLVSEVLADHAALSARARALARTLCGHAPLTMRATKEAIRRLREAARATPSDDLVAMCFTSDDFREGVSAFLARRKPEWRGR